MAFNVLDMAQCTGGASMAPTCCRWCGVARSSWTESATLHNQGRPPDHDRPIHNI